MKTNFIHAYKQAPWRVQLQWIGLFMLILVSLAVIAGVYLSLSERAATTGRRIQVLESEVNDLKLEINDLSTKLALISSARSMNERLTDLEMTAMDPDQALYLEVRGYQPQDSVILAPPPSSESLSSPVILSEFTASLWDWLSNQIFSNRGDKTSTEQVIP